MNKKTKEWSSDAAAALEQAAEWLARAHSDSFDEPAFRTWLAADDTHARAFENVLDGWELAGGLAGFYPQYQPDTAQQPDIKEQAYEGPVLDSDAGDGDHLRRPGQRPE